MGSAFYTFEEAANRLGRTKRTIHTYLKHGYLRKAVHNGKAVLHRDEVEQLAAEAGVDLPPFNHKNFYLLMLRVQKLEQDMTLCRRILEIRDSPLRPSEAEAKQLHAAAVHALATNYWTDDQIEQWATLFSGFDEVSLDMLREHLLQEHPYEVFFRLCLAQMKSVSTREEFQTSLPLQMLHKKLDEGRKKMRATLLMWTKLTTGTVSDITLKKLESEKDSLFKKLVGGRGK